MPSERPALFLDRDGVINEDSGYVYRIDDFRFLPGALEGCRRFHDAGYMIVVVTNQAGIARGYYTENDFKVLTRWMCSQFTKFGAPISAVYHCPHHPDGIVRQYSTICECRKPAPGLLIRARKDLSIDMRHSILVGDKVSDVLAAQAANVGRSYFLGSTAHMCTSSPPGATCNTATKLSTLAMIADSALPPTR